jgi:hypothetical protein
MRVFLDANVLFSAAYRETRCPEPTHATLEWAQSQGLPVKDAPILAAAGDARCHLLVTGDRTRFAALYGRRLRGTVVLLPVDAVDVLVGD